MDAWSKLVEPARATPLAPLCPRCHTGLCAVSPSVRREKRLVVLLCPTVTCGYKRIDPQ